ncbi:MAG: hypothetical protein ACXABY_01200 [Candidatus Thorarchaeota archaeon]|jgi:predicted amidophosphoribosyltransferase
MDKERFRNKDLDPYKGRPTKVCFKCSRTAKWGKLCPECGEEFVSCGYNFVTPKRKDTGAWQEARQKYAKTIRAHEERLIRERAAENGDVSTST